MAHRIVTIEIAVKATRPEMPGYRSVIFERPRGFAYEAGDWMDLQFAADEYPGGTTYSFASSPTEQDVVITFRDGVSPFKTALMAAKSGDRLRITQYGNAYDFSLRDTRSSVLIAGGVGVAPFRSMLKQLYDERGNSQVQLVYLHQNDSFLFKPELDAWQSALPNLTVSYIVTKGLQRKDREKILQAAIKDGNAQYFLAGPPAMVAGTAAFLELNGVSRRDIKLDSFDGY